MMSKVTSYAELKKLHEEYSSRTAIRLKETSQHNPTITVSMDSCGIEAGAPAVMEALVKELQEKGLYFIPVMNSKCLGHCSMEPLISINEPDGKTSIYVNLTPDKVKRIVQEHLIEGKICIDLLLPQTTPFISVTNY